MSSEGTVTKSNIQFQPQIWKQACAIHKIPDGQFVNKEHPAHADVNLTYKDIVKHEISNGADLTKKPPVDPESAADWKQAMVNCSFPATGFVKKTDPRYALVLAEYKKIKEAKKAAN